MPPPSALVRLTDEDAEARLEAITSLELRSLPARFALRHLLLADPDGQVRAAAAQKLGEHHVRRAIPALVEALSDSMPSVRDRAFRALARLGSEELIPHAWRALRKEPVWWVRRAAIRAAAAVAGKNGVSLLIEALKDPFWRVRHAAVQALGWIGEDEPNLRPEILALAKGDEQAPAASSAAAYLASLWGLAGETPPAAEDASPPPFVEENLRDEDPAVVTARLEALEAGDIPAKALVAWLGDPHAPLRSLARKRLFDRGDPEALFVALRWLDEPRVPHAAAEVRAICDRLGEGAEPLAMRLLASFDAHPKSGFAPPNLGPGALQWAVEVASLRHLSAGLELAHALAKHQDTAVRAAVIAGLAGSQRSLPIVLAALSDPHEDVRAAALLGWERRPQKDEIVTRWLEALAAFKSNACTARERRAVAEAASLLGDIPYLLRAADDPDPSIAALALASLAAEAELGQTIREKALQSDDPWIRAAVLDPTSALSLAVTESDPWLRRSAVDLVARRRKDLPAFDVLPCALACALAPDPWIRARAADLLDPTEAPAALHALLRLSRDPSPMARAAAATTLEACESLDSLLRALLAQKNAEIDDELRISALTWLLRRGDDEALWRLGHYLDVSGETLKEHLAALTLIFPDEMLAKSPSLLSHRPSPPVVPTNPAPLAAKRPAPPSDVSRRPLGSTGLFVSPLVLSGAHGLIAASFAEARDAGVNAFFWEPRYHELTRFLRSRRAFRDDLVLVTGTYHAGPEALRADVERALRRLRTDCLDVFLLFWVRSPERLSEADFSALSALRAEGKIKTFGFSTHDRKTALAAIQSRPWPVVMTRHSAAHPGAEEALLPEALRRGTGILGFTATSYGRLLSHAPGESPEAPLPTARDCYRYSLSQPGLSASLTAPRSHRELRENLAVLRSPSLPAETLAAMRAHGALVRAETRRFDALVRRAPGGTRDTLRALLHDEPLPPDLEM